MLYDWPVNPKNTSDQSDRKLQGNANCNRNEVDDNHLKQILSGWILRFPSCMCAVFHKSTLLQCTQGLVVGFSIDRLYFVRGVLWCCCRLCRKKSVLLMK